MAPLKLTRSELVRSQEGYGVTLKAVACKFSAPHFSIRGDAPVKGAFSIYPLLAIMMFSNQTLNKPK